MKPAHTIYFLCASLAAAAPTCTLKEGFIVGAGQFKTQTVKDVAECCTACTNIDGCVAFTFASDTSSCYLKDNVHGQELHANRTSGTIQSRTVSTRACHTAGHTDYTFCNTKLSIDERVKDLITRLKTSEKPPLLTARESPLGGVPRLGVPEYDWGTNCIHGAQARCGSKCPTSFPNPNAQGASWNRTSWKAMAQITGIELRALWLADYGENRDDNLPHLGLDCWSPNININRDPRWGRNLETPGEDPYLNGQYGAWHTKGLQEGEDSRYLQAIVTLKHWDAYSLEDAGGGPGMPRRHNFNAIVSKADLAGTYFPAFKTSVRDANAKGVMCSYNAVNGVPSCANKFLLEDVLRKEWGFSGYVTSDSGAVEDIYSQHHYKNMSAEEGVAAAVKAGCDIDSNLKTGHSSTGSPYTWSIEKALEQGLIEESDVDALLYRSLRMRFELGLFDPIEDQPYWHYKVDEKVDTEAAQKLNHLSTRESIVLLKNDKSSNFSSPALPLKPGVGTVAVLGPHANAQKALTGNYLGQICPEKFGTFECVESPAAAIARVNGGIDSIVVEEGCGIADSSTTGFEAAVAAASKSSVKAVVMMMGLDTSNVEREGHDRTELGLPGVQLQLIQRVVAAVKGKKPVIVVMLNGGAVAIDWLKTPGNSDAILEAFYPGKIGAGAIADILFGAYNPSGKLPYTIMPASFVNEVNFLDMSMTAGKGRTYRFYKGEPLWPFGYGLSYTTFSVQVKESSSGYQVEVKNTGHVAGDEVVQAYFEPVDVHLKNPAPLPTRQLFDFQKVHLGPGESATLQFDVNAKSLALADANGDLFSAAGKYNIVFTNGVDQTVKSTRVQKVDSLVERFPASSEETRQPLSILI